MISTADPYHALAVFLFADLSTYKGPVPDFQSILSQVQGSSATAPTSITKAMPSICVPPPDVSEDEEAQFASLDKFTRKLVLSIDESDTFLRPTPQSVTTPLSEYWTPPASPLSPAPSYTSIQSAFDIDEGVSPTSETTSYDLPFASETKGKDKEVAPVSIMPSSRSSLAVPAISLNPSTESAADGPSGLHPTTFGVSNYSTIWTPEWTAIAPGARKHPDWIYKAPALYLPHGF
ncbi:hypothetical protein BOTBODRAFT_172833 [Botryobasidium botryosum FD-172 SS1]|uniref:Uncharacterized protein n=1 Tax=Botryobasidium botryosum (strain FD-172 SS1) TaxID=930990 RepID=A0A067MPU0_BOTB1|nr:hypothetical protein BOTBODRAFT_172833 [Botryobasidium botryosum FD-172 SS1]